METKPESMSEMLMAAIKKKMDEEVKEEFDKMVRRMFDDLNSRKNEICAGILLNVMKHVSMTQFGDTVTFSIKEIKKDGK